MRTTLALLTAALFLLTTPALSLARDGRGHADGPRDRQERGWVQQRPDHDQRRNHQPPRQWRQHYTGNRWGCGHYRPQHHRHGHPYRDRLFIGLPSVAFQFRW